MFFDSRFRIYVNDGTEINSIHWKPIVLCRSKVEHIFLFKGPPGPLGCGHNHVQNRCMPRPTGAVFWVLFWPIFQLSPIYVFFYPGSTIKGECVKIEAETKLAMPEVNHKRAIRRRRLACTLCVHSLAGSWLELFSVVLECVSKLRCCSA